MKVRKVIANNRKKAFEIVTSNGYYEFPYSKLALKPGLKDPVREVRADAEIGYDGFTYQLASGKEDTIVMDQVLEYAKDPDFLRRMLLFKSTMKALERIATLKIARREVIRRMNTTPTQFYRLLDPKNTSKTIDQMVRLLAALDCPVDFVFGKAA